MHMRRKIFAILFGIILVSAGVFSLFVLYKADAVGQQEIEHYIAGFAASKPSEDFLAGETTFWDYYNYEALSLKTEPYSTWRPDYYISNLAKHDFSATSFTIDVDQRDDLGAPDYKYQIVSQYSSTYTGTETEGFIVEPIDLEFYDPIKDDSRTIRFYRTYITMQFTLRVQGQYNILTTQDIRGYVVPLSMVAEFQGTYQQNYGTSATDADFLDASTTMRIIFRIDVKNWALGDYIHIDPAAWNGLGNAVLWSKITEVDMSTVDQTAGWSYPLQFSGDFDQRALDLYSNVHDALIQSSPLPEKEAELIQLEDTLYPTVYFNLDHAVWLGTNMETLIPEGNLKSWDVSDFFVSFKVTSCILSTWMESLASEGEFDITNPFTWNEVVEDNGWLARIWNWLVLHLGGGNTFLTILYLVLILLAILLIVITIINPMWLINFFKRIGKRKMQNG